MLQESPTRTDAMPTESSRGGAQNFVDLYELLHLTPEVDSETLRKHINKTYLEAQQNLDHRNAHKRLQFQQLFEIYLPQARHLLLDPARRAEYDRYLKAYRSGSVVEAAPADAPQPRPPRVAAPQDGNAALPEMTAAAQVDAAKMAAEREALWAQWKNGLDSSLEQDKAAEEAARIAQAAAKEAARLAPRDSSHDRNGVEKLASGPPLGVVGGVVYSGPNRRKEKESSAPPEGAERRGTAQPVAGRSWTVATTVETDTRREEIEAERERERLRLEAAHQKARTTGMIWGIGGAAACLVVGFLLLMMVSSRMVTTNLVKNGDFSESFKGWPRFSLSSTVNVDAGGYSRAAHIVTRPLPDAKPYHINFTHSIETEIAQGEPLVLKFWARSPNRLQMEAHLTENKGPWTKSLSDTKIVLTPEWKEYSVQGKAKADFPPKASKVEMFLAFPPGGIYEITGVRLLRGAAPSLFGLPLHLVGSVMILLVAALCGKALYEAGLKRGATPIKI